MLVRQSLQPAGVENPNVPSTDAYNATDSIISCQYITAQLLTKQTNANGTLALQQAH